MPWANTRTGRKIQGLAPVVGEPLDAVGLQQLATAIAGDQLNQLLGFDRQVVKVTHPDQGGSAPIGENKPQAPPLALVPQMAGENIGKQQHRGLRLPPFAAPLPTDFGDIIPFTGAGAAPFAIGAIVTQRLKATQSEGAWITQRMPAAGVRWGGPGGPPEDATASRAAEVARRWAEAQSLASLTPPCRSLAVLG